VSHDADANSGNAYPHPDTWNAYANRDRYGNSYGNADRDGHSYSDSDGNAWRMSDGDHAVEQPDSDGRKLGLVQRRYTWLLPF
jgi:hypothetical protein